MFPQNFLGGSDPWSHVGSLQKCFWFSCKRGSWKTFVCQETIDIPGYSCYYRSAQASYPKGRCRGIQTPGRAMEKITVRHDKQQWMEQVASTGENHLLCGEVKDAFASFRQLKQKRATSWAPLKALDGKLPGTVRQGICCCKVAGALQHFTKSAYTVSPWCFVIWSTGIHARFHHWYLPSYDHWGL